MKRTLLICMALTASAIGLLTTTATAGSPTSLTRCGQVKGAAWTFNGKHGSSYAVLAQPASACTLALKTSSGLTRQQPHTGTSGPRTLNGPHGYRCGLISATPVHYGTCINLTTRSNFSWGPAAVFARVP